MKIFDAEFDVDFMDLETVAAYEQALVDYREKLSNANTSQVGSAAKIIRLSCEAVADFLDDVLGEGAANEIFGEKWNLSKAVDAMQIVIDEYERQVKCITDKITAKRNSPQNRSQRRFDKRRNGKHYESAD